MRLDVADRALTDRRNGLVGWSLGIAAYVGLLVAFYPSVRGDNQITRAWEDYPESLKAFFGGETLDLASATGFLNAQLFSLMVPLLLAVFAIGFGAGTLAGEDERGTLELLLANPVSRRRVVLEKALAGGVGVLLLAVVTGVTVVGLGAAVDLSVAIGRVALACLGAGLFAGFLGALAMLVGSWTGSRTVALATAAGIGVASYLLNGLSQLTAALEPLRYASPFYHAAGVDPLGSGLPVANFAALAFVVAVVVVATVLAFEHRDLAA